MERYANDAGAVLAAMALVSLLAYARGSLAVAGMLSLLVILAGLFIIVRR